LRIFSLPPAISVFRPWALKYVQNTTFLADWLMSIKPPWARPDLNSPNLLTFTLPLPSISAAPRNVISSPPPW
jgi:hypothetical protein